MRPCDRDVENNEGCGHDRCSGVFQQSGQSKDQGTWLEGKEDESLDSYKVGGLSVGEW